MAQQNLPLLLTKRILKDALHGLAELHCQNIVHTGQADLCIRPISSMISAKEVIDIKPNNILIQWSQSSHGIIIDEVCLGDLEDSAYVPPGSKIRGRQVGNQNWRSPEAHAEGCVNKPSDMFSFGLVVSGRVVRLGPPGVRMIADTVDWCIYAVLKHVILLLMRIRFPRVR